MAVRADYQVPTRSRQTWPQARHRTGPQPALGAAPKRLTRPAMPAIVLTLIGAGAGAVLALWWQGTPSISGTGDLLTSAGDILGLLSAYGFVVLVALMARLPPLERGIGSDRLSRWHAMGGRYVITLVTGHVLMIVWGYAVTAHESVTSESVTLLPFYLRKLTRRRNRFLLFWAR